MTAADYPLRAVAWYERQGRKHPGARRGAGVWVGLLSCGHAWSLRASAPVPRRVHCRYCQPL